MNNGSLDKYKIISRLGLSKQILLTVFIGVSLIATSAMIELISVSRKVTQTTTSMLLGISNSNRADKIQVLFKSEVQAWKNILLRGDDPVNNKKYTDELDQLSQEIEKDISELSKNSVPEAAVYTEAFLSDQKKLTAEYHRMIQIFLSPTLFNARAADTELKGKDRKVLDSLNDLSLFFKNKIDVAGAQLIDGIQGSLRSALARIACWIVFVLSFAWYLIRKVSSNLVAISEGLSKGADLVEGIATKIASANAQLSESAIKQASALQETSAAVEETRLMISKNFENSKKSSDNSQSSKLFVFKGQAAVAEMLSSIDEIAHSNADIMKQIEESNLEFSNIVKVISGIGDKTTVINDIVFQTKLLSFNASVEAARAGEQGKGFAVVAEEVGNLAQMSGNAAKEISDLLKSSIQEVEQVVSSTKNNAAKIFTLSKEKLNSGTLVAERCKSALDEIVASVTQVVSMSNEITSASKEQTVGVNEIGKAMIQLDESGNQNLIVSRLAAQTVSELSNEVVDMRNKVHQLNRIVRGNY